MVGVVGTVAPPPPVFFAFNGVMIVAEPEPPDGVVVVGLCTSSSEDSFENKPTLLRGVTVAGAAQLEL